MNKYYQTPIGIICETFRLSPGSVRRIIKEAKTKVTSDAAHCLRLVLIKDTKDTMLVDNIISIVKYKNALVTIPYLQK